ncbi:hypothetical protein LG634_17030 [Streptomyces bambusae]|uniref:hypothetical protein n=1 Tax=Streptomyces bambusae TaxID=1550616 RepID=UPI001CFE2C6E|nr:hypothetical protein [Streptomyces bambusae]MCB5166537.1 hypothetical protein [Streptomyces bambusae]
MVPVLGAGGGTGRSTIVGLIASYLCTTGTTVVLDTAPWLVSHWPAWAADPGAGVASVPPDRRMTPSDVRAAASRCSGPDGDWQVLTDHQEWSSAPLHLPAEPAAWYQLAAAGGWQVVIGDTAHPMAHDIVSARSHRVACLTAGWCSLPCSVPVLAVPATGPGVSALQIAVRTASAEGLPLQRMVVALTETGEGRVPAVVRAAATMLQSQVAQVVIVPYEPRIRAGGLAEAHLLASRKLRDAVEDLGRAVLSSAHRSWGDPLPAAPAPAAAPPVPGPPPAVLPARTALAEEEVPA